jgi:hypothetical protein
VTTAVLVGSVACALAPFVRRRRAQTIERQQLKWLAAVAAGSGLAGVAGFVMPEPLQRRPSHPRLQRPAT